MKTIQNIKTLTFKDIDGTLNFPITIASIHSTKTASIRFEFTPLTSEYNIYIKSDFTFDEWELTHNTTNKRLALAMFNKELVVNGLSL